MEETEKDEKHSKYGKDSARQNSIELTSPRRFDKVSFDNSFKIVQLAIDYTKNGKELLKIAEEDKKGNYPKLLKLAKKVIPTGTVTKIMKMNHTDLDRRRQSSLQEFLYVTEKLKQRVTTAGVSAKEGDPRLAEDANQLIQEGHMILAAVLLNEMHTIISLVATDSTSVGRQQLMRLLFAVKNYCDGVTTMKFPPEWENMIQELSKKGNVSGTIAIIGTLTGTSGNPQKKKNSLQDRKGDTGNSSRRENAVEEEMTSPRTRPMSPTSKAVEDYSLSDKEESDKEDTEDDANESHTIQIEIRGNTGGFVGSTIEFDLVVTNEDGSPVKVHASDFSVEIHGPAASSPVNILPKGKDEEGSFRIEFVPKEAGANTLSIYMHNTLLTSGIRSIISKAGETAFLIHAKDLSKGQLQGISVVPSAVNKNLPRAQALQQKLEDIGSALEVLESLRAKTLVEIEELNAITNEKKGGFED